MDRDPLPPSSQDMDGKYECPRCGGQPYEDEGELYCLPCGARLELVEGRLVEFRRPNVEPEENPLEEVLLAAAEGGTYKKARRLLRRWRKAG